MTEPGAPGRCSGRVLRAYFLPLSSQPNEIAGDGEDAKETKSSDRSPQITRDLVARERKDQYDAGRKAKKNATEQDLPHTVTRKSLN
jgi:hypothetical protein